MPIILCTNNYNFSAKYETKTSSCPITSACPITKPQVYFIFLLNLIENILKLMEITLLFNYYHVMSNFEFEIEIKMI